MVKLEEVMDEEFVREQEGPHDEDEWDTDSGTSWQHHALLSRSTRACRRENGAIAHEASTR